MLLKSFFLIIFFSVLSFFASAVESKETNSISSKRRKIENLIADGKPNSALNQINILLLDNRTILSKNDRYELLVNESKIQFFKENMNEFLQSAEKAFKLKKRTSPIYESYYCAQKAAFFHYFILGDSTIIYANRALKLLHENWNNRSKISYHFVYQIYATAYLYKNITSNDNSLQSRDQRKIELYKDYFDSSLIALSNSQWFPQEKAIIYRSMGNRILDFVGYQFRHSKSEFKNPKFQLEMAKKALSFYDKAIYCLPNNENQLKIELIGLKALTYYLINEEKKADELIFPYIDKFHQNPIEKTAFRLKESLYLLKYFTLNIISKNKYDQRIEKVIDIYECIRPFWGSYSSACSKRVKDSYGSSPSTMILLIDHWLKTIGKRRKNLNQITVNCALENYLYYSRSYSKFKTNHIKNQFLNYLSSLEYHSIDKTEAKNSTPFYLVDNNSISNLKNIKRNLDNREAILLRATSSDSRDCFILITNNGVYSDTLDNSLDYYYDLTFERDINEFKRKAYQNFRFFSFTKLLIKHSIKKLYVACDITDNFDFIITDTTGNSFKNLKFLKKRINIVKIYNPIDFLSSESFSKIVYPKYWNIKLISEKDKGKFPFSERLNENKKFDVFTPSDFSNSGILHLIGHGKLENKLFFWKSNDTKLLHFRDSIRKDLIILNQCFGSYQRITYYPDRDLQNYLIASGAKSVIASPFETIDQSSAWILRKFYGYLKKEISVEDALQKAKLDYLNYHKGALTHPIYWSTFQLTTNVKDLKFNLIEEETNSLNKKSIFITLIVISLLIIIILFIISLKKQSS